VVASILIESELRWATDDIGRPNRAIRGEMRLLYPGLKPGAKSNRRTAALKERELKFATTKTPAATERRPPQEPGRFLDPRPTPGNRGRSTTIPEALAPAH